MLVKGGRPSGFGSQKLISPHPDAFEIVPVDHKQSEWQQKLSASEVAVLDASICVQGYGMKTRSKHKPMCTSSRVAS